MSEGAVEVRHPITCTLILPVWRKCSLDQVWIELFVDGDLIECDYGEKLQRVVILKQVHDTTESAHGAARAARKARPPGN